jgi:hypothetical protein
VHLDKVLLNEARRLPVLRLDEEAKVRDGDRGGTRLAGSAMDVDAVSLFEEAVKLDSGIKERVRVVLRGSEVIDRSAKVLHAVLAEPRAHLLLVDTTLCDLLVGLKREHGSDTAIIMHALNVDLVKRIRTKDDVEAGVVFANLVEEESLQEGTVRLLSETVNGIDLIHHVELWCLRRQVASVIVRVLDHETTTRLSLEHLLHVANL